MYSVVLVDDERLIVRGLKTVINWAELGCEVTESDEAALDRYEGFPTFYYKREMRVQYKGIRTGRRRTVDAFVYIMHEDRPFGVPEEYYVRVCRQGYDTFGFDQEKLTEALRISAEEAVR